MKILDIRLKNLNSLRGEWDIDLTDKVYTSNGIFVITGSTGAGKTTIFDAICLALYGQTPRLGKITKDSNEIMSRRTNDCYAQVIFEVEGKKYSSYWHQHKSKYKKLQDIKHIFSNADTGEIFTSKTSDTVKKIEEITGLDFKRFSQAVMLEQGGFDSFLKAKASERSQILELLTGTEIYGRISTLVYEHFDNEKKKLDEIKIQIELKKPNDNFNSSEEIIEALIKNRSELLQIEKNHAELKNKIDWLKNISKIKFELQQIQNNLEQLNKRLAIFSSDKIKLEAGLKANELIADYSKLTEKRNYFSNIKIRCEKLNAYIVNDTSELSNIESVKLPDIQIEFNRKIRNLKEDPETTCAKAKSLVGNLINISTKIPELEKEKLNSQKILHKSQLKLKKADDNYKILHEQFDEAMKKLSDLTTVRYSAILEDARRHLKNGVPCPVCGSLEHHNVKHSKVNENNIAKIDDELKVVREHEKILRDKFNNASENLREIQAQHSQNLERFNNLSKLLNDNYIDKAEAKSKVLEAIEPLGIFDAKGCNEIIFRLDNWLNEVKTLDKNIKELNERLQILKSRIETNKKSLADENYNLDILTGELEIIQNDFNAKLTEKNFNSEENFKASILSIKELEKLQNIQRELEDNRKELSAVKENITQRLQNELAKSITDKNIEQLEPEFLQKEKDIEVLRKKIYELEKNLDDRKKLQSEIEELNEKYKVQEKIYSNWAAFNDLIGQKNGGKYRVFAQKITLNMMISLANVQLEKMSGRYILTSAPDDDKKLKLFVIDKEQAGEIRPTENLSGGERFIVSLALALGLSQISGSKSKIDSLFLDEGFGSLDEASLSTALEALAEIKSKGRMIGIISHIQALKERIPVQINVIAKSEGVSIIKGVGCSNR